MAFNGKYVTVDHILERVRMDYGFDQQVNFNEGIEWIYSAIRLLGVPVVYTEKITDGQGDNDDPIEVSDYKAELPVDLHQIITVKDYDTDSPLLCVGSPYFFREDYNSEITRYTYKTNDSYLFTDMEDGELVMSYHAIPLDEKGYPKIADDERYMSGVISFIAWKIAFRMYLHNQLSERKYQRIEQEYLWYIASGNTSLKIPSLDALEAMKNRTLRLYTREDYHNTTFRDFHAKEDNL